MKQLLCCAMLCLTALVCAMSGAEANVPAEEVVAKSLTIVDTNGQARIKVGMQGANPHMTFFDEKGARTMQMYEKDGKPWICLFRKGAANSSLNLWIDDNGEPSISLTDSDDDPRIMLNLVGKKQEPFLHFADEKGAVFKRLPK